jgi:hypothetical protein
LTAPRIRVDSTESGIVTVSVNADSPHQQKNAQITVRYSIAF